MGFYVFLSKQRMGLTENWNVNMCIEEILDRILSEQFFDTIRTKECFGYIVNGGLTCFGDPAYYYRTYKFIIQSPNKSTDEMIEKTKEYINNMSEKIKALTPEEFDQIIHTCIEPLLYPFKNLRELSGYYFEQIISYYDCFNLNNILIETYKSLSKEDLVELYENKFIKNRKSIIVVVNGVVN